MHQKSVTCFCLSLCVLAASLSTRIVFEPGGNGSSAVSAFGQFCSTSFCMYHSTTVEGRNIAIMCNEEYTTSLEVSKLTGFADTVIPRHVFFPAKLKQFVRVHVVTKVIERSIFDELQPRVQLRVTTRSFDLESNNII